MAWTENQLKAIELKNKNMLLSAAAGSGKTAVLVERIKRIVIEERVPVDKLLVVTFTNKAAAEMKERLVQALTNEIEKDPDNSFFLRSQLNSLYKADICTFHAFALSVIRRYYYVIGADPGFKIADEAESKIMKAEAADKLFEQEFASGSKFFKKFLDCYSKAKNFDNVKKLIVDSYDKFRSMPNPDAWINQNVQFLKVTPKEFENSHLGYTFKKTVRRQLLSVYDRYKSTVGMLEMYGLDILAGKVRQERDYVAALIDTLENKSIQEFRDYITSPVQVRLVATKDEKEAYAEIKENVKHLRDRASKTLAAIRDTYFAYDLDEYVREVQGTYKMTEYFCELVKKFGQLYKEEKRNKTLIDFGDIEHMALAILNDETVAAEYRERIEYIFIDEYQDSNLIQEALIDKIKRRNNLFMVGDVKQSIYKFRLAEPEIFMSKYEKYKEGIEPDSIKIDLNTNFRSKDGVIRAVNNIFKSSMAGYDNDAALNRGIEGEGEAGYKAELYVLYNEGNENLPDEIADMKAAEREAHMAVKLIKDSVGMTIYDVKKTEYRPLRMSDIVVLMRGIKNTGSVFQKVFTENNIPCFVDESDGYFDTIEIEVFMNLLRLIDNKKQDIPLLSVLHSPIFGFTAEELAEIRIADKKVPYHKVFYEYSKNGSDKNLAEKCRTVYTKLEEYRMYSLAMPLSDFIWKLIWDTGYYAYVGGLPSGKQRQANLRTLADKAMEYSDGKNAGIYDFLRYIENLKEKGVPTGQTKLISESDDVVRIMTVHKSKGLEYPMVILAGIGKRFNYRMDRSAVAIHKDIGIGMTLVNPKAHWHKKTLVQKLIEYRMDREAAEEELRILYVACTRAKDKLVLLGSTNKKIEEIEQYAFYNPMDIETASNYLEIVIPTTGEDLKLHLNASSYGVDSSEYDEEVELQFKEVVYGNRKSLETFDEISRRLTYEYPYKKELSLKSKYSVTEITSCEYAGNGDLHLSVPLFAAGKKAFSSAQIGTIYHSIIEHLDFTSAEKAYCDGGNDGIIAYIEECVDDMVVRELLVQDEAEVIKPEKIVSFVLSDLGKRMVEASKNDSLYREMPFTIKTQYEGTEVLVQGIIDCWFTEKDSRGSENCVLVDYKTSYAVTEADEEKLRERYKGQIELYKQAIEKVKNIKVNETYLWLFALDKAIRV